ncbi:MAG TPA: peptidoglycan DD-metalloendopeptidase family protein [Ferruginibacter sp.]|nr:peptidoglycan DD-metalloendopeptidase family protein [Ferruginibacter sp.]HMP22068.1 peptidoglycan DD-metalloendopeptidase family protein [Ferruginibacter sp.]
MKKNIAILLVFIFASAALIAQPPASKEQQDLERQRQELKRELEQAQELLNKNKKSTKENLTYLQQINHKLHIQSRVVDNINREINLMDNTIYKSQRDINKLKLLLDTLKQEYARSMVYAYKNRSNADFLNFIFSSNGFNDAIKRITYLKSYRNYREMQGENILRTQAMLKERITDLNSNKQKKSVVLQVQNKEVSTLKEQQDEKNKVVASLKAQSKELNNQIAAKKKQMQKVNNAIAAAIKRAVEDAKKAATAKAIEDRKKKEADVKDETAGSTAKTTTPKKAAPPAAKQASVLLATEADVTLNTNFERNKGNLPWPVNSGYILLRFGSNKLDNGVEVNSQGISIGSNIGNDVKAIFDGEVMLVNNYDDVQMVVVKHGRYFTGYSNISGVTISKGQKVRVGQVIGKVAANLDGVGAVDLQISNEQSEMNPEIWLKRK